LLKIKYISVLVYQTLGCLKLTYHKEPVLKVISSKNELTSKKSALKGCSAYLYSFQGQERDDEVKGAGNSVNYKYRMHDPRLGRFFAVDGKTKTYPELSPYSFSANRVIDAIELEGLESAVIKGQFYEFRREINFNFGRGVAGGSLFWNQLNLAPQSNVSSRNAILNGDYGTNRTEIYRKGVKIATGKHVEIMIVAELKGVVRGDQIQIIFNNEIVGAFNVEGTHKGYLNITVHVNDMDKLTNTPQYITGNENSKIVVPQNAALNTSGGLNNIAFKVVKANPANNDRLRGKLTVLDRTKVVGVYKPPKAKSFKNWFKRTKKGKRVRRVTASF